MVVNLMVNTSPEIVIDKVVSMTKQVDCALKANCDMFHPTLVIYDTIDVTAFNYFQIPDFGRYYYIDSPLTTHNENTFEITGNVDVLMSFKQDIRNASAVIDRNENEFIKYITDSKYTVLNYERVQTKVFPNSFPADGQFILVVAGS